jgi:hypothetical protein
MKVLSLLQPWASLVISGAKTIETRSWSTTHRGTLLIHASSGKKGQVLSGQPPFDKYIEQFNELPFGAIIGSVYLYDVVPVETLPLGAAHLGALTLEEKAFGDYTGGRYAWLFREAAGLAQPIFIRGALGLWNYNPA